MNAYTLTCFGEFAIKLELRRHGKTVFFYCMPINVLCLYQSILRCDAYVIWDIWKKQIMFVRTMLCYVRSSLYIPTGKIIIGT